MFWGIVFAGGLAIGIAALVRCLTPRSFGDLEPKRRTRRPPQPLYLVELPTMLDHSLPTESMTIAAAQRESRLHAECPPWLCPRKTAALAVLDAHGRRTPAPPSIL